MFGHKWFLKIGELTDASISGLTQDANELVHCSFSFHQGMDLKGQAQTNVRAGDFILTYDGLPSQEVILWAMTSTKLHNGSLVLCDANGEPIDKLFFEDSACTGMSINYINDGKSPIITQLRLQPRKITAGDESLVQAWLNIPLASTTSNSTKEKVASTPFKLIQPIGKISLCLVIEENKYEIEWFKLDFSQGVDQKGEPQEDTKGGIVEFSIDSLPDKLLNRWMLRESELKNGVFIFEQGEQNSPLKITFTEAFCVKMATRTLPGRGLYTEYTISANEIDLNGKWLYNNFKL